jgi:hypothetical protein
MRIQRAGHIARMGEIRNTLKMSVGKSEGRYYFKDVGIDEILLKLILRK